LIVDRRRPEEADVWLLIVDPASPTLWRDKLLIVDSGAEEKSETGRQRFAAGEVSIREQSI